MPDAIMRSLGIIPDGIDVTIMTVVNTLSRFIKDRRKLPWEKQFLKLLFLHSRGVARRGPGVPVIPLFLGLLLSKYLQYSGGENAMTISWP